MAIRKWSLDYFLEKKKKTNLVTFLNNIDFLKKLYNTV